MFGRSPRDGEESMAELFKDGHIQDMVIMVNKPPKWNECKPSPGIKIISYISSFILSNVFYSYAVVGAYVLNFNGRVTMASVKNFQLVTPEDHDRVILQFGRTAKVSDRIMLFQGFVLEAFSNFPFIRTPLLWMPAGLFPLYKRLGFACRLLITKLHATKQNITDTYTIRKTCVL